MAIERKTKSTSKANKKSAVKKKATKKTEVKKTSQKKHSTKSTQSTRARTRTKSAAAIVDQVTAVMKKKTKFAPLTPEQREMVLAVLSAVDNLSETSRITGVDRATVTKIRDEAFETGELQKLRVANRGKFVENAWNCIALATQTIEDGLVKGYVKECKDETGNSIDIVSKVSPSEASRVIRDLHHSTQLEEGKPTSIVEQIADSFGSDQEILDEIARLEKEIVTNNGQMH